MPIYRLLITEYTKIKAINLCLNLSDLLTTELSEKFEKLDFFASITPGGVAGGHMLILHQNNVSIDYGQIKLAFSISSVEGNNINANFFDVIDIFKGIFDPIRGLLLQRKRRF